MNRPKPSIPPEILSELAQNSPWAMVIFSGESLELRHWNGAFAHWIEHRTGSLPPELRIPDLLAPNSRAEFHRTILSHAKVFSTWEGPLFMLTLGGEPFQAYACIISFRTPAGEDLCALIASTSHLAAASSEISNISDHELLHALLETVPMDVYFKDLKSRFIRVSAFQAKKHNYPDANEMVGLSDFDIFSLEHAQPAFTSEQAIIATGEALVDIEEKETYTDQADTWVSTSKFPLTNRAGHVVGTFGLSKDITTQHLLAEEQRRITQELAELKNRNELSAKLPGDLLPHTQQALQDAQSIKAAFNQLLPLLAAYRKLAEATSCSTAVEESLRQVQSIEKSAQPDQLILRLLGEIERNVGSMSRVRDLLGALDGTPIPDTLKTDPATDKGTS